MPAPGHTAGHAMLALCAGRGHAIFSGGCFHCPLQLTDPSIQLGDCDALAGAMPRASG